MPSVRLLKAFSILAETQHFGEAAERLGQTQPALSLQIKDLEEKLGVTLLDRRPRALQLTTAGEALLPEARAILQAIDRMAQHARQLNGPLAGRLRMGVIPTIAPYLLPPLLPLLDKHYDQLDLEVTEDKTDNLVTALRAGTLDLALLALPLGHSDLMELPLFDDKFYLVGSPQQPLMTQKTITAQDIAQGPLLLLDEGHCLRDQALSFCRAPAAKTKNAAFRAASLQTLTELVAHGMGVTLLPEMALARDVLPHHKLKVRPLPMAGAARTIGLVWRKKHPQEADFQQLAKLMGKLSPKNK